MNTEIVNLIVKIVFGLLAIGGLWLFSYAKTALQTKAQSEQATELDKLIYQFAAAAEQQLKADDPTGEARKQYVIDLLAQLGFIVNAEINARIEAAVYQINLEQPHEKAEKP